MVIDLVKKRLLEVSVSMPNDFYEDFNWEILDWYYNFLLNFNQTGGFFSKSDGEKILDRHFIEPLIHVYKIKKGFTVSRETKLADIGTGPGIPGFFFQTLIPSPKISLIDSQIRRLKLLEVEFQKYNSISDINFIYQRVEDVNILDFDILTMRSAIPFPWCVEVVGRLLKKGGYFFMFTSKKKQEDTTVTKLLSDMNFVIEGEIPISEMNYIGERNIIVLQKLGNPKMGFPRSWDKISKEIKKING
jgi:16S rRNA (guanine527-N7)-methyltransferase